MCEDTIKEYEAIANKSIKETIEIFFKHPSGFHGDTGIQHYLYHRILTNASTTDSAKIFWENPVNSCERTLCFQSEVFTDCTYRNKGMKPGRGRFDMAFIEPPNIHANGYSFPHERLKALIAFEVGRNKDLKNMGDYNAPRDNKEPKPGDAAKIIRDLRFRDLKGGYILEFYDQSYNVSMRKAREVRDELRDFLDKVDEEIRCRLALSVSSPGRSPEIFLYPDSWSKQIALEYDILSNGSSEKPTLKDGRAGNHITYEEFLLQCSEGGRALQEAIHNQYFKKLKLLCGSKTMTVNRHPKGRICRIGNNNDKCGECIYEITADFARMINLRSPSLIIDGRIRIPLHIDDQFLELFISLLEEYLGF